MRKSPQLGVTISDFVMTTSTNETQRSILYADSGPTIVYGTPHQSSNFTPWDGTQFSTESVGTTTVQEVATISIPVNPPLRPRYNGRQRLWQAATAMLVAATEATKGDEVQDEQDDLLQDSETQIPTQFLHFFNTNNTTTNNNHKADASLPQSEEPLGETSPTLLDDTPPSATCLVIDDSETQVVPIEGPSQLPPNSNIAPTVPPPNIGAPQPPPTAPPKRPRGRPKKAKEVSPVSLPPGGVPVPVTTTLPELWSALPAIYPDPGEIIEALQDPGKKVMKLVGGTRQPVTNFPLIQRLSSKIYQSIQTIYNPEGLTKNSTRGSQSLASSILLARKSTDATTLDPFFHQYAKNGRVYIITNNPVHSGLDIPIKEYQSTIVEALRKARSSRTSNDGLRLALTMLDPKYRESISLIMSNRKERVHSDITGDFVLHFFEHMLTESFANPLYKPPQASSDRFGEIDAEEVSGWDPNDPSVFEVKRSATWLLETWKVYVKRRYKLALDRWNKETGGGNGHPWSFINYCDRDSRWLVAVFLKDLDANYLLAASAGGRMPNHLQMECGFAETMEVSSLGESSTDHHNSSSDDNRKTNTSTVNSSIRICRSKSSSHKRMMMEEAEKTKKLKGNIYHLVDMVTEIYKKKEVPESKATNDATPIHTNSEVGNCLEVFRTVTEMNRALVDREALETMSPRTREKYTRSLQSQRKRLIEHMSDVEERRSNDKEQD